MRRVSIEDIARHAEVSHSTVSRALRGNKRISLAVRTQILQIANELGYTPNAIAQSLQQRQTNTIGLVVTDVADPFWGEVVKGVEAVSMHNQKALFLSASQYDPSRQLAVIEVFHQRRVDGIIVGDSQLGDAQIVRLARIKVPTVFLNSQADHAYPGFHAVGIDNYAGGVLAAQHLWALGHRHLAYLGSTKRPASNQMRGLGFAATLRGYGLPANALITHHSPSLEDDLRIGYELARAIDYTQTTALFCYNDSIALGALTYCRSVGIDVPAQLSIVGFDDVAMAQFSMPALTTIAQPKVALGETAMQLLLAVLAGQPTIDTILTPTLVVRQSSAPAPKGTAQ